MIQFHSDLDNTLIYSYKYDIGPNKISVERYQGREVSFMISDWIDILRNIQDKILYVPTTTRTIEQYNRISMGIRMPEYALVCNGGVLLKDGYIDNDWYQESIDLIADSNENMLKSIFLLESCSERCFEIRYIEKLFVFTKSKDPATTVQFLSQQLDLNKVDVFNNGIKVYVVPKNLSKGNAILRLKKRTKPDKIISAGDSEFDISMLLVSDIGICPKGLMNNIHNNIFEYSKDEFTEKMLRRIESYL